MSGKTDSERWDVPHELACLGLVAVAVITALVILSGAITIGNEMSVRMSANAVTKKRNQAERAVYELCSSKAKIGIVQPGCPGVKP